MGRFLNLSLIPSMGFPGGRDPGKDRPSNLRHPVQWELFSVIEPAALSMLAVLLGCIAGAAIVAFQAVRRSGWWRWMARHPAPTFVFADLVGYTELTEAVGDEAAARVAKEFRVRWRPCAAGTGPGR